MVSWELDSELAVEAGSAPDFPAAGGANPSPGTIFPIRGSHVHVTSMLSQRQYLSAQGPEQFPFQQPAWGGGQHLPKLSERMSILSAVRHVVFPAIQHLVRSFCPSLTAPYWLCSLLSTGITCATACSTLGQPSLSCLCTEHFMQYSFW